MTPTAFSSLKPGDAVEFTRGRMAGARAQVLEQISHTGYVRVLLPSGYTRFVRPGAIRVPAKKG